MTSRLKLGDGTITITQKFNQTGPSMWRMRSWERETELFKDAKEKLLEESKAITKAVDYT